MSPVPSFSPPFLAWHAVELEEVKCDDKVVVLVCRSRVMMRWWRSHAVSPDGRFAAKKFFCDAIACSWHGVRNECVKGAAPDLLLSVNKHVLKCERNLRKQKRVHVNTFD